MIDLWVPFEDIFVESNIIIKISGLHISDHTGSFTGKTVLRIEKVKTQKMLGMSQIA